MPVIATVTDPDSPEAYGGVTFTDWEWQATSTRDMRRKLKVVPGPGGTTSMYTGQIGQFLWALVDYRDGASLEDDPVTAHDERNYMINASNELVR